jgi:glycosyltransferase involved in cell wall biosynthesis
MQDKLSIIIPCYNEERTLSAILDKVISAETTIPKEIIIVDNNSKDKSPDIAKEYSKKHSNVKYFLEDKAQGKGAAVKKGIKESSGTIILIQDADLEYDPDDYQALIEPILKCKAIVVYGSRRLNKNNKQYSGFSFFCGGILVTLITNILFFTRISDEPTCYKVFRSDVIKSIKIEGNRFEWEPEVTAKIAKKKIKIFEVPIKYYPRTKKEGKKINWKDGFEAIWTLIKVRFSK